VRRCPPQTPAGVHHRRPKKRAVGFKLFEGMDVPAELASRFKFAPQKSKLAGTIRGSYFAFESDD
jgi:hypothetical protein